MAIRVYPFGRALGAVDRDQIALVVQTLTARLTTDDTLHMVHTGKSLWRDWCTLAEREEFRWMAEPHRATIRKIHPPDVWSVLAFARPDLYAVLSQNGGKPWLHAQAAELKVELLR